MPSNIRNAGGNQLRIGSHWPVPASLKKDKMRSREGRDFGVEL
jgi:hypothetical protein